MRKLLLTTAAVAAAIAGAFADETDFGTFTDTRDGQTYKTVKMPDGKTWMAQNLNYKTTRGSWCYKDSLSYCKKYGRLYEWDAAMKACPSGYHLPSGPEWDDLAKAVGGKKRPIEKGYWEGNIWYDAGKMLKAKHGWVWDDECNLCGDGTDNYGFSALPGGFRDSDGSFGYAGSNGDWWTATEDNSNAAYERNMNYGKDSVIEYSDAKNIGNSVRCVADRP